MTVAPVYAPEIRLGFGGAPAPAALRGSVTSISSTTGLGGADRLELTFANERLRWLDSPLFALENEVSFAIGYAPDEPTQMFVGEVTGTEASFPSAGMPTLRVIAQDRRTRLSESSPARLWAIPIPQVGLTPLPDLAVAPAIGLENELATVIDPVGAFLSAALLAAEDPGMHQKVARKQHSQNSLEFLEAIAAENGWDVLMDHGRSGGGRVIRLMSPAGDLTPAVTLRYGQSLIDFSPKISKVGQVAGVSVHVWRPEIKLELTVKVGYDWDKQSLDIEISPGFSSKAKDAKPGASKSFLLVDQPTTVASAPRLILSKLLPKLNKRLTATGACVGNPNIAAGRVLRIDGVGATFGGFYRVTQARHTLDAGGYRTSFDLRKEIWFGSIPAPSQGAVHVLPIPLPARG